MKTTSNTFQERATGAQYRLAIRVGNESALRIRAGMEGIGLANRFILERDAREMQALAAAVMRPELGDAVVDQLRGFGTGREQLILTLTGLLPLRHIPPTPYQGHGDDTLVQVADLTLLGVLGLMSIDPVAYSFENYGRLIRNVVPAAKGALSSHGYDRELPFHSDNEAGWFERAERPVMDPFKGVRAPIPRFLGFVGLRNRDAAGKPVATDVLAVAKVLRQLDESTLRALGRPAFCLRPPESNDTTPLQGVPLLVVDGEQDLLRFSLAEGSVTGLDAEATAAIRNLRQAIAASEGDAEQIVVQPGSILVFDNTRVFHRRTAFEPGELDQARWMRRVYGVLNLGHGRFLDRYHRPFEWD